MTRAIRAVFLLAAVFGAASAAAQSTHTFDFITHNEVVIAASPAEVWPHLRNVNAWKMGARTSHAGGPKDGVGERLAAAPDGAPAPAYFIETVELAPARRWTIRLNTPGGDLMGYATWTLAPANGGTIVRYDTFLLSRLPGDMPVGEVAAAAARTNREAAQRMDSEFARLKQLAESSLRAR